MALRAALDTFHVVNLRDPDAVDDTVCDWLTEAYVDSPE
jgi:hypothetical protein